jgi:hypothetical protein
MGEIVGWGIQFHIQRVPTCNTFGGPHSIKNKKSMKKSDARIQRVPTWHTFGGPYSTKNKKYMKKRDDDLSITFFHVFLIFFVEGGPPKVCQVGIVGCGIEFPIERVLPIEI